VVVVVVRTVVITVVMTVMTVVVDSSDTSGRRSVESADLVHSTGAHGCVFTALLFQGGGFPEGAACGGV
jgi:hypothetical protein